MSYEIVEVNITLSQQIGVSVDLSRIALTFIATAETAAVWGADRARVFALASWQAQAAQMLIDPTEPIYLALRDAFASQQGHPQRPALITVIRRVTPVAQVDIVTVGSDADGSHEHTINDGINTATAVHVAAGQTIEQKRDAILAAVQGLGLAITAAALDTDKYTITANRAGLPMLHVLVSPANNLTISNSVANIGVENDLGAAATTKDGRTWYFAYDVHYDIAAAIGLHKQVVARDMGFAAATLTDAAIYGSGDDVFSDHASTLEGRFLRMWHPNASQQPMAAWLGRVASYDPLTVNWAHRRLPGSTPVDFTEPALAGGKQNLGAKRINFYEDAGVNAQGQELDGLGGSTRDGWLDEGFFLDQRHFADVVKLTVDTAARQALQQTPFVDYDDPVEVVAAIKTNLAALPGFIPGSVEVEVVGTNTQSDQNNRIHATITFTGLARRPANMFRINGTIEV